MLQQGVRGITDLMVMPGLINLDFADVRSVMHEMGKAMMGTGEAEGDGRALEAAEKAIANPLLDGVSMQGAKGVIVSITGGEDMRLMEVDEAANHIRELVDPDANIIWGSAFNENLNGKIRVSVVATGIDNDGSVASPARMQRVPLLSAAPAEPVAVPAAASSLFETDARSRRSGWKMLVETTAEDDSLELGSDFVAEESDEENTGEAWASEPVADAGDVGRTRTNCSNLATPMLQRLAKSSQADVTPAPDSAAPRISTGGTLFERMSNLSRGLTRSDDDEPEDKDGGGAGGLNIPRFLDRQSNN